jgi:ERCC4-type nuclease
VGVVVADFTIAIDTREQDAHGDLEGCEVSKGVFVRYKPASLLVGDYCVYGDWTETAGKMVIPNYCIERKSISDLIGSWFSGSGSRRELAKIDKCRNIWGDTRRPIMIICDGDYEDIKLYRYDRFPSGRVSAKTVLAKIRDIRYKHNVHVVLCPSKVVAEWETMSILKSRWKEFLFKQKTKGGCNGK